jgi:hypothetical protein
MPAVLSLANWQPATARPVADGSAEEVATEGFMDGALGE